MALKQPKVYGMGCRKPSLAPAPTYLNEAWSTSRTKGSERRFDLTLVVANLARFAVGQDDGEGVYASSRVSTNCDAHDQRVAGVTGHDRVRARMARDAWFPIEARAVDDESPRSSGDGVRR